MFTYRVDDLDQVLTALRAEGWPVGGWGAPSSGEPELDAARGGSPLCPVRSSARIGLTCGAAFLGGALLLFLTFAAIYNGSWVLLIFFLLCYTVAVACPPWRERCFRRGWEELPYSSAARAR